jgi:hypothetical protein
LIRSGVVLLLAVPVALQADQDPATDDVPRVLPYQGYLDQDGEPLSATGADAIHIRFSLYDGPEASETLVYQEDKTVEVFAGRFSVLLGPTGNGGTEIATVVAGADELHLGITLLNDPGDPADDIPLGGRQLITPMPYALWSTKATNLEVASSLTVGTTTMRGFKLSDVYEASAKSEVGEWGVSSEWLDMTSSATSICFLTEYDQADSNHGSNPDFASFHSSCRVIVSGGVWKLQAYAGTPYGEDEEEVICRARCLEWNW